ncbi:hypothetical protein PENSPDRAFT_745213 [Peniophora sp. CONT]|nr:hypothetical protein PENSPDRAFT_745213 [Peniophora sp. CONT]
MPVEPTPSSSRRLQRRDQDGVRQDGTYAREIEMKRSRGEISCAECRRLKIKCDKSIPCQSCQRRGCAALCPNGSLATGQGTRFVIAATEHLHKRIARMSDRIRQLEDGLAVLQSAHSKEQHPLLHDSQLLVEHDKAPEDTAADSGDEGELNSETLAAFGTMSVSEHGLSRFFGPTGGSEGLLLIDEEFSQSPKSNSSGKSASPALPPEVVRFYFAFPFTPMGPTQDVYTLIMSYLPSYEIASAICECYLANASWLFRGLGREQLMDEMLPVIYNLRPAPANVSADQDYTSPHALGLFFSVLAVGRTVDIGLTTSAAEAEGEHYNQLAHAALCLRPVLERPSMITVQALHVASIYNAMSGSEVSAGESTMESTWSLVALACHIAHTIGLHRDSARWETCPKMVQRRRTLFWDLFVADAWHALSTGRPPSMQRIYIDCQYPEDKEMKLDAHGNPIPGFGSWGFRFAFECVAEIAAKTLAANPPRYSEILELDRKVRDFAIPPDAMAQLRGGYTDMREMPLALSMIYFVLSHTREVMLLFIHRGFFAQALIESPVNPLRSQYAPSFLASVRAASTVLRVVREQFAMHPSMCSRFWSIWTYAFSAAIVFGGIVTRGPRSHLADTAMAELEQACDVFSQAAKYNRRASKAHTILSRLRDKAVRTLATARSHDPAVAIDDGAAWDIKQEDVDDELAIFAGRTMVLRPGHATQSTPSPPTLPRLTAAPPSATHGASPVSPYPPENGSFHSWQSRPMQQPSTDPFQRTPPPPPVSHQYRQQGTYHDIPAAQYNGPGYSHSRQHPPMPPQLPLLRVPVQHPHHAHQQPHSAPSQHQEQLQYMSPATPDPDAIHLYQPHSGYGPPQPQQQQYGTYTAPPPELVQLGLAPNTRGPEGWNAFISQSSILG